MKPIKMFGLAALAALMAMAFVGAGSAMAEETALCPADEEQCATPVTHLHAVSVEKMKLLSNLTNIECNILYLGETVEELSSPLVLIGNFTYTNCGSCTVTEENGPGELYLLKTGHEKAKLTLEWLMHVNCFGFINCYYTGAGLEGVAKGPLLPFVEEGEFGNAVLNFEKGSFCPEGTKLDYWVNSLSSVYITS